MANRSRQTFIKRQKERARMEKARQKSEKRSARKEDRDDERAPIGAEDPDIMGIVPGPQPVPWETEDLLTPEEKLQLAAEKEAEAKAKEKAAKEAAERR